MIEMISAVDPLHAAAAAAVIAFAYAVFGVTGFGSTAIAMPLLAHFMPLTFAVPLMVLLDLVAAMILGPRGREAASRDELLRLLPWLVAGIAIGAIALVRLPQAPLKVALGVFVVAVGIHGLVRPAQPRLLSRWWAIPAGLAAGSVAALFGAGGPIYAVYLSGRLHDTLRLRDTVSRLVSLSALVRAAVYAIGGLLLQAALWIAVVALAPFVWAGLRVGGRIHTRLDANQMRRVVGTVLVLSGAFLLLRAFPEL